MNHLGERIASKRKELGLTQKELGEILNISFQAISKWEAGSSMPDSSVLPSLAQALNTSIDGLFGYSVLPTTVYEARYQTDSYYWGLVPNKLCYDILQLKPPVKPYRVLDIGCGEGKDAVFLARNGYQVSAFDISENGLKKARILAGMNHVNINFFKADVNNIVLKDEFDIIFSSGVLHYLAPANRQGFIEQLKEHTAPNGIHAVNVFVQKPFLPLAPDLEEGETLWYSGELDHFYADWFFHKNEETIFDCTSGGIPHQHCMDILIAEKR